ncbi:MAG: porin family protein [Opitutaceae bacterium]|jgi:opacity protein-like surface antigen|nr:porin family protein [Opitutaceae bacterium]
MKTTTASIRIMGALLITLGATLAATAQTSPPTPRSVAPNYTPPKNDPKYYYQDEIQSRSHTWDFYLKPGVMIPSDAKINNETVLFRWREDGRWESDYIRGDLKLDLDTAFAFGFGFDYNFTGNLAVGVEMNFTSSDYKGVFHDADTGDDYKINGDASIYMFNAFVQYNFIKGKFTPFVRGNLGFMYLDSGISSGDWWTTWHNYRYYDEPTVDDTYFMLGASAGLRYDFNHHVSGAVSYTANWIKSHKDWELQQLIGVSVGWNY